MVASSVDRASTWTEANQRYLVAELARIRRRLEGCEDGNGTHGSITVVARSGAPSSPTPSPIPRGKGLQGNAILKTPLPRLGEGVGGEGTTASQETVAEADWPDGTVGSEPGLPSIEFLRQTFGLSGFERDVLLLCAGVELEAGFAAACATAQGDSSRVLPTFGLALAILDAPHWSALAPDACLRRWRMVEVVGRSELPLTASPLRIDERILHFLAGVDQLDARLVGLLDPVVFDGALVPSHFAVARQIALGWTRASGPLPLVRISGADEESRRRVAAAACVEVGLRLFALSHDLIPTGGSELDALLRLWEREAILTSSALYVDADEVDSGDVHALTAVSRFLERVGGPTLVSCRDRWRPPRRPSLAFVVQKPSPEEQHEAWRTALGGRVASVDGRIDELVAEFDLNVPTIQAAARQAQAVENGGDLADALWLASRAQARPRLEDLARRIEPVATWDDLVLPVAERDLLRAIGAQVRHRAMVYRAWGLGKRGGRGLGISALFAGPSGTGKTMAAEVLAGDLGLDLFRIDLSSVVSKYIGETEKNLRRVFDAAEDGGTILFFDEADALFGKRSEVKDSHDRYANVEISYLLQRMEAYRGLAILATNLKGSLDPAFLRRIRFVVNFPFPDAAQRLEIWRRTFPPTTPTAGLDLPKLARLSVAGGNIRNIALNAAFYAAEAGQPIGMAHLARAARDEFAKLEKPLADTEIGDWT